MKVRLLKNASSFFILPTITVTVNKTWYGYYEIAIVWLRWHVCLEWGYEN
jgi:hypothetical protein